MRQLTDEEISDIIDQFEGHKIPNRKPDIIDSIEAQLDDQFRKEYELAEKDGKKKFGSACKHTNIRQGRCLDCLRKVR